VALEGRGCDKWMPTHLKRICSVIDELRPDLDIVSSQQSEPEGSGLSQGLESHNLAELSNQDASSLLEEVDSQSSCVGDATPETSVSERIKDGAFNPPQKGVGLLNYISEWSHRPQVSIRGMLFATTRFGKL